LESFRSAEHLRSAEDVICFQCLRSAERLQHAGHLRSDDDLTISDGSSILALVLRAPKLRSGAPKPCQVENKTVKISKDLG
jgi:hypothetical protein